MMSMITTMNSITSATPQSFCSRISSTGKMACAAIFSRLRLSFIAGPTLVRWYASDRIKAIFKNSAGCMVVNPRFSQLRLVSMESVRVCPREVKVSSISTTATGT